MEDTGVAWFGNSTALSQLPCDNQLVHMWHTYALQCWWKTNDLTGGWTDCFHSLWWRWENTTWALHLGKPYLQTFMLSSSLKSQISHEVHVWFLCTLYRIYTRKFGKMKPGPSPGESVCISDITIMKISIATSSCRTDHMCFQSLNFILNTDLNMNIKNKRNPFI